MKLTRSETQKRWYYSEAGRNYFKRKSKDIKHICSMANARLKIRAKNKNLAYNIDTEYLISIYPKDHICPVLGYKMRVNRFAKSKQDKFTPTVNRIDPSKGYIKGNVEFICQLANLMLANANKKELKLFRDYLNKNL